MEEKFGYEDLQVWQRALDWASEIIGCTQFLNTSKSHFRLVEQLEAASCSVAQNIAEGKGRYHNKEYIQFLYIARGSLYETVTLLELFCKQNWITTISLDNFKKEAIAIAKMLNSLIRSIKKQ